MIKEKNLESWGRLSKLSYKFVEPTSQVSITEILLSYGKDEKLAIGSSLSYGDVGLNSNGLVVSTRNLDRLIQADWSSGVIRAEAGITFDQILNICVPRGWFLPVVPGTKFITLGGAVANDVHGKNHGVAGTFGCHIKKIGLAVPNGDLVELSLYEKPDLFRATIAGLGLTGIIVWVEFSLKKISSSLLEIQTLRMRSLDDYFRISQQSIEWEHTIAWVDCLAKGSSFGRGVYMRARHLQNTPISSHSRQRIRVPNKFPINLLNVNNSKIFNALFWNWNLFSTSRISHYNKFFFPLDSLGSWNQLYGPLGFYQHQSVIPKHCSEKGIEELLKLTSNKGQGSFFAALKNFGSTISPGLMSFPMQGTTFGVDIPNTGIKSLQVLCQLSEVVELFGGRVYPAKDAVMQRNQFRKFYPEWQSVDKFRENKFNSNFWRRVVGDG